MHSMSYAISMCYVISSTWPVLNCVAVIRLGSPGWETFHTSPVSGDDERRGVGSRRTATPPRCCPGVQSSGSGDRGEEGGVDGRLLNAGSSPLACSFGATSWRLVLLKVLFLSLVKVLPSPYLSVASGLTASIDRCLGLFLRSDWVSLTIYVLCVVFDRLR